MITQLQKLAAQTDDRYATDADLRFLEEYLRTARTRFSAYKKLREAEAQIVQKTEGKVLMAAPSLLPSGATDLVGKWRLDTVRVLRYAALALLIDDSATFHERMLLWFSTLMRAFKARQTCDITYTVLQEIVQQHLTAAEADLFLPILELTRCTLGKD